MTGTSVFEGYNFKDSEMGASGRAEPQSIQWPRRSFVPSPRRPGELPCAVEDKARDILQDFVGGAVEDEVNRRVCLVAQPSALLTSEGAGAEAARLPGLGALDWGALSRG